MTIAGVDLPDKTTYTFNDFMRLPEDARVELVHGQIVRDPGPTYSHQRVSMRLSARLWNFVSGRGLGEVVAAPTDVRFSDTETYHPDLLFLSNERLDRVREQYVDGAPDLVVEILSPSTRDRDLTVKRETYETSGVREYWIVDIEAKTVEVLVNGADGFESHSEADTQEVAESSVLDGFSLEVATLFQSSR